MIHKGVGVGPGPDVSACTEENAQRYPGIIENSTAYAQGNYICTTLTFFMQHKIYATPTSLSPKINIYINK